MICMVIFILILVCMFIVLLIYKIVVYIFGTSTGKYRASKNDVWLYPCLQPLNYFFIYLQTLSLFSHL